MERRMLRNEMTSSVLDKISDMYKVVTGDDV